MTLIANSFFLSFQTLWRYLIVMPFVLIPGILVIFALLVTPMVLLGQFILIGILFAPFLVVSVLFIIISFLVIGFTSFNTMIGCRSAFGAMGRMNDLDFGRLMGKTIMFTLVQMIAAVFIAVVLGGIVAAVMLLSPANSISIQDFTTNPELATVQLLSHPIVLVTSILLALGSLAVSALLSVPMAGAAISATPKMGPTDAFLGLGTAFLPVLAVLIAINVLGVVSGAFDAMTMLFSHLIVVVTQMFTSAPITWLPMDQMLICLGFTMLVIWSSCWFYTAAALGWKGYTDDREAAIAVKVEADRFSPEELRSLREKRDRERGQ